MVSWDFEVKTKHGFTLTVMELVQLAIEKGFTNIESIEYYGKTDGDCCRIARVMVNSRCKELFQEKERA